MERREFIKIAGATVALPVAGCTEPENNNMTEETDYNPNWETIEAPERTNLDKIFATEVDELEVSIFVVGEGNAFGLAKAGGISVVPLKELRE